jgi:biotin transport system substrate-specific component
MLDARLPGTLIDTAWSNSTTTRRLGLLGAVVCGVCLLTLSAKLQVPFYPVPMTMQTLVVLMIGMACGRVLGTATVAAYLLAGAAGLPVFAGTPERGIGSAYMMGPTGGFLAGFLVAAWLAGALAERGWSSSFLLSGAAMVAGHVVILAAGVAWLSALVGLEKAIALGLMPFLVTTLVKCALGAVSIPLIWRAFGRNA